MKTQNIKARLDWLASALTTQRALIARTLSRLRGFGAQGQANPVLHSKFMRLLTQAAFHRRKEDTILDEIEEMERRHQALTQSKGLRRATSLALFDNEYRGGRASKRHVLRHISHESSVQEEAGGGFVFAPSGQRPRIWRWLFLFYLLSPSQNNRNKQDIAPN